MKARAQSLDFRSKVGILIEQEMPNGGRMVAAPCQLKLVKVDFSHEVKPTFMLTAEAAQSLSEALHELGYAPRGSELKGLYDAQSKHLADLQKLIFGDDGRIAGHRHEVVLVSHGRKRR